MHDDRPSLTALAAAAHRAAHQVLEEGRLFHDPLALAILGDHAEAAVQRARDDDSLRRMRLFIAARTRIAEDALTAAVDGGVSQLVVLGAGLDTYAYRGAQRDRLRIFEVDHPATQAWKRQRLHAAGIEPPPQLSFAPVDFESQTLAQGLDAAGFDRARPTFFTWLGVVPYLAEAAIFSTLGFIAGTAAGSHVVFDYSDPPHTLEGDTRAAYEAHANRAAAVGEAWISHFEPDDLRARLGAIGFRQVRDEGPRELAQRIAPAWAAHAPARGGHVLHAST